MSTERELADYATMRHAIRRANRRDTLVGGRCSGSDCDGGLALDPDGIRCRRCGRWAVRFE